MTTQSGQMTAPRVAAGEQASLSARLVEFLGIVPVHFILILISVIWLVPSVGLLVTSIRERQDILTFKDGLR